MSQGRTKCYEVYRDAAAISLEEIIWEIDNTGSPTLKVKIG